MNYWLSFITVDHYRTCNGWLDSRRPFQPSARTGVPRDDVYCNYLGAKMEGNMEGNDRKVELWSVEAKVWWRHVSSFLIIQDVWKKDESGNNIFCCHNMFIRTARNTCLHFNMAPLPPAFTQCGRRNRRCTSMYRKCAHAIIQYRQRRNIILYGCVIVDPCVQHTLPPWTNVTTRFLYI